MSKKTNQKTQKETTPEPEIPLVVEKAADCFGVNSKHLMAWRIYTSGKVVLISANGMKFVYEELAHDSQSE